MKKARKLITFILAAVMIMSMSLTVMAEPAKGTISIENAIEDVTYSVYRILDLESYDEESEAFLYKVNDKWKDFFSSEGIDDYIAISEDGYATWVGDSTKERAAELAEKALNYAETNSIAADATMFKAGIDTNIKGETVTVEFGELDLGYYLVDSNLGVLCTLNTNIPNVTIEEKNEVPTAEKVIVEEGNQTTDSNSATIGDVIQYQITISAKKGAENYKLHDTMSEGLTFNEDTLEIKVNGSDLASENYVIKTTDIDGKTFVIEFNQAYLNSLTENTTIVVTYSATLNEKAAIAGSSNTNQTYLEYGNNPTENFTTPESKTNTYSYEFDLVKYDGSEGAGNKLLKNAKFKLYESKTAEGEGENPISFIIEDGTYRVAVDGEEGATEDIVVENGVVKIQGLSGSVYYLEETMPPAGYNPTDELIVVDLSSGNRNATINGNSYDTEEGEGIAVENNTGSMLPSTGGIGTTIFYIVGGVLVVFAVVLLVTKKRMKNEE